MNKKRYNISPMNLRIPPALQHKRFRYLWFGLMVSVAGSQMQVAALHWHVRELTPEPVALGAIGLARFIPVLIFSLMGGAIADRINRRNLVLYSQFGEALIAGLLAYLTFQNMINLSLIYTLTALQAMVMAFGGPARQALIPNLVPAKDLPNAFSLNSIAFNVGTILGPALAGLVIGRFGQGYTYLINAVSFFAVIWALLAMGPVMQDLPKSRTNSLVAIADGIKFIWNNQMIKATMIMDFFATFFASANTLMPIIARDVLQVDVIAYGWLSAAQSIGAVTAGLIISQIREIRKQGPIFLVSVVIFGLATILFGVSTHLALAISALIVIGASDAVSTIIRNTIRQLSTPDEMRGRMTSINQIFFQGGPQLGEMEAGLAAQFFGAPFAIVSGGVGCILAVLFIMRRWPMLRAYDRTESMPTTH